MVVFINNAFPFGLGGAGRGSIEGKVVATGLPNFGWVATDAVVEAVVGRESD